MPFVKGVVPFLKGDGQLVKGADRLKLLSKLAVFPLLLIHFTPYRGRAGRGALRGARGEGDRGRAEALCLAQYVLD